MSDDHPTTCEHGIVIDWGDFTPGDGPLSVCSRCLKPGQMLRNARTGVTVTLDRRKRPDESNDPGWWLRDGFGGLVDWVIKKGDWIVVEGQVLSDRCPTCGQPIDGSDR